MLAKNFYKKFLQKKILMSMSFTWNSIDCNHVFKTKNFEYRWNEIPDSSSLNKLYLSLI